MQRCLDVQRRPDRGRWLVADARRGDAMILGAGLAALTAGAVGWWPATQAVAVAVLLGSTRYTVRLTRPSRSRPRGASFLGTGIALAALAAVAAGVADRFTPGALAGD